MANSEPDLRMSHRKNSPAIGLPFLHKRLRSMPLMAALAVACPLLGLTACSSVTPMRVPADADKERTANGLRYYETRPFLLVRKPYPIASTPYLVHGVLSNDGKSFLVIDAPAELKLPAKTLLSLRQPLSAPSESGKGNQLPPAQGDSNTDITPSVPSDDAKKATDSACEKGTQVSKQGESASADQSEETKEVECKDTSGQRLAFSSISLETDLTATALIPVNELFSIIYLPDYDREFYIESKARWGASRLHIVRGPGGALLAYNSEVDNSAVVKPIFDAWNALAGAATKSMVIKIAPKAQGERVDANKTAPLTAQGKPVTIRVHEVKYAVPGAYPFIKPQEIGKPLWVPTDATPTRILVPTHPYQIPYDYFTVLVAEQLLDPAGTSGIIDNVSVAPQKPSVPDGNADKNRVNCPGEHKRPPADYQVNSADLARGRNADLANTNIKSVTTTRQEPLGCAATVELQFTGDASKENAIETFFKSIFPGTEFDATHAQ